MEVNDLPKDIRVFGFEVKSFPNGINQAFDTLIKQVSGTGEPRSYYGISTMANGKITYYVTAEEVHEGEAEKYGYQRQVFERGKYLVVTLKNWKQNTNSIKDLCHQLVSDARTDKSKPMIEWYKNDDEMMCMLKML